MSQLNLVSEYKVFQKNNKKEFLIFLFLVFACFSNSIAQTKFENGYFIDNSGAKTDCLIKNEDWANNPTVFEYKLSENSEIQKATINTVQEFGVPSTFKYIKYNVEIDRTFERANLGELSYDPKPNFKSEELFLKVLIEGEASLYMYSGDILRVFFYKKDSAIPLQLFYKRYKKGELEIAENNQYKQTLYLELNCVNPSMKDEEKLSYSRSRLVEYFEKYNTCKNSDYISLSKKKFTGKFNLSVRPRVNFSSFSFTNTVNDVRSADFGDQTNFGLGLEAELILDAYNSAWSIFIEPSYYSFKDEQEITSQTASIDFKYLQFASGVRRYFFLDDKSKLFLNAAYVHNFNIGSDIDFEISASQEIDFSARGRIGVGGGYNYNNKVSIEFRTFLGKKDILNSGVYTSELTTSSIILGYTLF